MITTNEAVIAKLCARQLDACSAAEIYPPGWGRLRAIFLNGDMEDWGSATDLNNWSEGLSGGTVNRDGTDQRNGTFCARFDKTSAAVVTLTQDIKNTNFLPVVTQGLTPGKWYHVSGWTKVSAAVTGTGPYIRIFNQTPSPDLYLQLLEATGWTSAVTSLLVNPNLSQTYVRFSRWFQLPATFGTTDAIRLQLRENVSPAGSIFWDDWNVEGPFDRPGLYYATKTITHRGDDYTPQILKTGPTKDTMKIVQPRSSIVLANANRPLRAYIDPDTFAGGRIFHRVIFLDPASSPTTFQPVADETDLVYFQGVGRRPKKAKDLDVTLPMVGRLNPRKQPFPGRSTATRCQVRRFADGTDCPYTHTTTATNDNPAPAAASVSVTVAVGTLLRDGQKIKVGNSPEVTIASGGGTVAITLDTAINWKSGDAVRYTACDRTFKRCEDREQETFFLGFRRADYMTKPLFHVGDKAFGSAAGIGQDPISEMFKLFLGSTWNPFSIAIATIASPGGVVPFFSGRRWTRGVLIEEANGVTAPSATINIRIYLLGEGPCASVVRVRESGEFVQNLVNAGGLHHGTYWRPGSIGIAGAEDVAAYTADPGGTDPDERPQNTDLATVTQVPYSRSFYAIVYTKEDADFQPSGTDFEFDCKALEIQKYLATGATDGALVWSPNPPWATVAIVTTPRYGFDLLPADLDMAVIKPEADYCDVEQDSKLALTISTASATSAVVPVEHTDGFYPGQTIDVGGDTGLEVEDVSGPTNEITLTASITYATNDVVQGKPRRWEAHYNKGDKGDGLGAIRDLLFSCLGFLTTDYTTGKLQIRAERNTAIDHLTNGNLDAWTGSVPDGWIVNIGGGPAGTVTEETSVVHTPGGSAAKLTRTTDDGQIRIHQGGITTLQGGHWYLASGWIRATTPSGFGFNFAFKLRHRNLSNAATWWNKQDGTPPAWEHGSINKYAFSIDAPADTWLKVYSPVWIPPEFDGDTMQLELHSDTSGHAAIGEDQILYLDDWKYEGPLDGYYRDTDDTWLAAALITNGGMENWTAGVPDDWVTNDPDHVRQASGDNARTGSFAALFTNDEGYLEWSFLECLPGREYEISFWRKYSVSVIDQGPRVELFSHETGNYLGTNGVWSSGIKDAFAPPLITRYGNQYQFYTFRFTVEDAHETWQGIRLRFIGAPVYGDVIDDITVRGPIDRVPILQPGMGIVRGTFDWLNDDEERREVNQVAVPFQNEARGGQDDVGIENDYDNQDRLGFVKKREFHAPAVAHKDHAVRLAMILKRKLVLGASGAKFTAGWMALAAQPGGVVAIRHEQGPWTGHLRRITKRGILGAGNRRHMLTKLEVEDYNPDDYTQNAPDPGDDDGMASPLGTLTIVIDSITTGGVAIIGGQKTIKMHAETTIALTPNFATVKWYRSTVMGFTPAQDTLFQVSSHNQAQYSPKPTEVGSDLYFVCKIFITGAGGLVLTSAEKSVLVTGITCNEQDPTASEYIPGANLIRKSDLIGDFVGGSTGGWIHDTSTNPAPVRTKPDANIIGVGYAQAMIDPELAYDGAIGSDNGTAATASVGLAPRIEGSVYRFLTGAQTVVGRWVFKFGLTNVLPGLNEGKFLYSEGPIGPYFDCNFPVQFPGPSSIFGPIHAALNKTDLRAKVSILRLEDDTSNTPILSLWDLEHHSFPSQGALFSSTYGGLITMCSDGVTDKTVDQVLPFDTFGAAVEGAFLVFSMYARELNFAGDANLFVKLRANDGSFDTIMSLTPTTQLTVGWRRFAARVEIDSTQTQGPYTIRFSSLSTRFIQIARPSLTVGQQVYGWGTHANDPHPITDFPFGAVGNFTPGPWSGDYTSMTRIAEVT